MGFHFGDTVQGLILLQGGSRVRPVEIQCLGNTGKPIMPSLRKSCCLCLDSNPSTGHVESHVPDDTKKSSAEN